MISEICCVLADHLRDFHYQVFRSAGELNVALVAGPLKNILVDGLVL